MMSGGGSLGVRPTATTASGVNKVDNSVTVDCGGSCVPPLLTLPTLAPPPLSMLFEQRCWAPYGESFLGVDSDQGSRQGDASERYTTALGDVPSVPTLPGPWTAPDKKPQSFSMLVRSTPDTLLLAALSLVCGLAWNQVPFWVPQCISEREPAGDESASAVVVTLLT